LLTALQFGPDHYKWKNKVATDLDNELDSAVQPTKQYKWKNKVARHLKHKMQMASLSTSKKGVYHWKGAAQASVRNSLDSYDSTADKNKDSYHWQGLGEQSDIDDLDTDSKQHSDDSYTWQGLGERSDYAQLGDSDQDQDRGGSSYHWQGLGQRSVQDEENQWADSGELSEA